MLPKITVLSYIDLHSGLSDFYGAARAHAFQTVEILRNLTVLPLFNATNCWPTLSPGLTKACVCSYSGWLVVGLLDMYTDVLACDKGVMGQIIGVM